VAVYDSAAAAPYVEDIQPAGALEYIDALSVRVYELARERGGSIPYTVVREVAENLIHSGFAEPVVSVLDGGHTIRFSDQGPGIPDKQKALQPGFTTASSSMKGIIRGVGSGLPIVSDFLRVAGGSLSIEDKLSGGCVVTVSSGAQQVGVSREEQTPDFALVESVALQSSDERVLEARQPSMLPGVHLTTRQKQVLALVLESGLAGPSLVSRELGVGLSTAYRDLAALEDLGLISSDGGKRVLTSDGLSFLGAVSSASI
jgi:anti-sigma regulatory factor (Ser/Thr protein kinase)